MDEKIKIYNKKYLEILNGNPIIKGTYSKILSNNDEIINEDIYRLISYEKFYKFLKESKERKFCLTYKQVLDLFPLNSTEYKKIKKAKSKAHNIVLDIAICDFNNANDVYNAILYFIENPSDELVQELYSSTCEEGNPCTSNIAKDKILMLFPLDFNIELLRHEFIHYLQFIKSDSDKFIRTDLIGPETTEILEEKFGIDDSVIEYLNDLNEYEPLLNDFCEELKKFKNLYYKDLSNLEFVRLIYKTLFRKLGEREVEYLNRVLFYEHFEQLMQTTDSYGFELIIYFNILKYRVTALKNLLFGYFSKELTPKWKV